MCQFHLNDTTIAHNKGSNIAKTNNLDSNFLFSGFTYFMKGLRLCKPYSGMTILSSVLALENSFQFVAVSNVTAAQPHIPRYMKKK